MKWPARIVLCLIALIGWIVAPIAVLLMLAFGGSLAKQRAEKAAVKADELMEALLGGAWRFVSQGAANNKGIGWRILAVLLKTGWPGHLDQFKEN